MKNTIFGLIAIVLVALVALNVASALPDVKSVKISGNDYVSGEIIEVDRGEKLDIQVKLFANASESNVDVEAAMLGYEYGDRESLSDSVHTFDMTAGDTTYKDLTITIPDKVSKDYYDLRVRIGTRTGTSFEGLYRLHITGARHLVVIKDVAFIPENNVKAGTAIVGIVRVKNMGEKDEEGIKISIAVPALGIASSDYIDTLESDESTSSEEIYLRIPRCAKAGSYEVTVTAEYDESYETETYNTKINVVEDESCTAVPTKTENTYVTIGPESQDITRGKGGAAYPITITNAGSATKTYVIAVDGTYGWATTKITPSNVLVIAPGETKAAYVYVSANDDAAAGERMFSVTVSSDSAALKTVALKANVLGKSSKDSDSWDSVKKGLEIALIALFVLLLLIALVIGFNRLRGNKEESEEEKTYY